MGVDFLEMQTKCLTDEQKIPLIHKAPMEGILIVDGRPRMERLDMPSFRFESILALQRFNEGQKTKD